MRHDERRCCVVLRILVAGLLALGLALAVSGCATQATLDAVRESVATVKETAAATEAVVARIAAENQAALARLRNENAETIKAADERVAVARQAETAAVERAKGALESAEAAWKTAAEAETSRAETVRAGVQDLRAGIQGRDPVKVSDALLGLGLAVFGYYKHTERKDRRVAVNSTGETRVPPS